MSVYLAILIIHIFTRLLMVGYRNVFCLTCVVCVFIGCEKHSGEVVPAGKTGGGDGDVRTGGQ